MILVGLDFSCNKPACCIKIENKFYFALWPLEFDDKSIEKLENANIYTYNRHRLQEGKTSSEKFRLHISMANNLSQLIMSSFKIFIENENVIIAFEGSSFASRGDAALQLIGYRYILTNELGKLYGLNNIYTYAPLTIKSVAGCASKNKRGKNSMIEAFKNENIDHPLCQILRNSPELLRKKTNYISGIDDLWDAYWTLKTLQIKENL